MAKILIVDDSRTSRKILKTILEGAGHEVIGEAVDGVDGVNKFQELSPEITTLDITMPNMDGLEALKEIKKVNADAKIIMVTAAGQQNKMVEAIKSGASEFVTKPFEAEEIVALIAKMYLI
ncbi:MAG: response regulator [Lachnospiraceae bacterium]|nr:response regulator [Lachnospiraceae bacterium]